MNNVDYGGNISNQIRDGRNNELLQFKSNKIDKIKDVSKKVSARIHKPITKISRKLVENKNCSIYSSKSHNKTDSKYLSNSKNNTSKINQSEIQDHDQTQIITNLTENKTETNPTIDSTNQDTNPNVTNETTCNVTDLNQTVLNNTQFNNTILNNTVLNNTNLNQTGINSTTNGTMLSSCNDTSDGSGESTKSKVKDTLLAVGYAAAAIAAACAMNPEPLASKIICAIAVTVAVVSFVAVVFCAWLW
jgi:hypothetical protein